MPIYFETTNLTQVGTHFFLLKPFEKSNLKKPIKTIEASIDIDNNNNEP